VDCPGHRARMTDPEEDQDVLQFPAAARFVAQALTEWTAAGGVPSTKGSTDMTPTSGGDQGSHRESSAGDGRAGESADPEAESSRDHLERARRLVALELDLAETRRRLAEDSLRITEAQLELAERELAEVKAENERLRREIEEFRGG
jgi:hypothetical protein